MKRGLEKRDLNSAKEAPAGQLANVWDNHSKRIKINYKKEKARGNKSRLHTILYIAEKIVRVGSNRFPREER